ncbi:hypothetical protein [Sulfurimonas sp.]|jgi:hypothetical protein|uniref:hypothetical protein n=1 Tax=Sulfurimonas sp. TaxID=2022749 RepID=UPI0025D49BE1|nr:hypothetical protein [Sulfurimonas sp.]MBT5934709.1 hypothetical protein [Sulfurimonas sp.]
MKKNLIILAMVFMSSILSAKESGLSLSVAFIGMSMDYREYDNNIILDSEISTPKTGVMRGADLGLTYTEVLGNGIYTQINGYFNLLSGETEYVGSLLDSSQGYGSYVGVTKNILFDTGVDYQFISVLSHGYSLNFGIGTGYRAWRRELSPSQVEVYKWLSIRPQVGTTYSSPIFSLGVNLEYQYGIHPEMAILANSENSDITVNLGSADIIQLSIPFKIRLDKSLDLFFEYIYEYQTIEKSDTAPYILGGVEKTIYEPASTAHNSYVKLGVVFKF